MRRRTRQSGEERAVRTGPDPAEPMPPNNNYFQAQTSPGKLRGQYYTPDALVAMMLEALDLDGPVRIVDPSCGDGRFLRGAVSLLARRQPGDPLRLAERLAGFDIDAEAVRAARRNLQEAFRARFGVELPEDRVPIHHADALDGRPLESLLRSSGRSPIGQGERVAVVGNPPYVEAKRLPRELKAALKQRFPEALTGAPDLCLYFLHACLDWLRAEDMLALILPNKFLVNANARRLRERLLEENRLRELWFATQARVFEDASVYPVVLFAGGADGGDRGAEVRVRRIERNGRRDLVRGGPVRLETSCYRRTGARAFFPPPETGVLQEALQQLLHAPGLHLGEIVDLRWSVSFHRAGLRERYVTRAAPASPHARRFLGGGAFSGNGEVRRYRIEWAGWWIDYDAERLQREGNPVPDARLFAPGKIAICQNGRTLRAAYDETGWVLKDTFLCGRVRDRDHPLCRHPRALVGILCSRAAHFFYSHVFFGGHVGGGYLHFLQSFLVDLPVGTWDEAEAEAVAVLVRRRERAAEETSPELEEEIERRVSAALGLGAEAASAVRLWAEADPNWTARERVRAPRRGEAV